MAQSTLHAEKRGTVCRLLYEERTPRLSLGLKTAQQFHASLFEQITSPQGTGKAYKFSLFMEKEESESYVPPAVEVITVNVEQGYDASFGGDVVPWE